MSHLLLGGSLILLSDKRDDELRAGLKGSGGLGIDKGKKFCGQAERNMLPTCPVLGLNRH